MKQLALEHYSAMAAEAAALAYQGRAIAVIRAALRDVEKTARAATLASPKGLVIDGIEYVMPADVLDEVKALVQTLDNMYGAVVNDLPTVVAIGPRWLTPR